MLFVSLKTYIFQVHSSAECFLCHCGWGRGRRSDCIHDVFSTLWNRRPNCSRDVFSTLWDRRPDCSHDVLFTLWDRRPDCSHDVKLFTLWDRRPDCSHVFFVVLEEGPV